METPTFVAREFDVLGLDDGYSSWSATYDDPNPLIVAEERALLPILDRVAPGVAVDAATGTGRVAHLRGRGHRVLACDRSEQMLRGASTRLGDASVVQADLIDLPIRDGSVDLLTCSLALTHVERLPAAFESFGRVMRPGGLAVISDIHPFAVATGAQAFFRREDGSRAVVRNEQHWVSDYVAAATSAGFAIEGCEEVFIDDALLAEFAPDAYAEAALLDLPFGLIWRPGETARGSRHLALDRRRLDRSPCPHASHPRSDRPVRPSHGTRRRPDHRRGDPARCLHLCRRPPPPEERGIAAVAGQRVGSPRAVHDLEVGGDVVVFPQLPVVRDSIEAHGIASEDLLAAVHQFIDPRSAGRTHPTDPPSPTGRRRLPSHCSHDIRTETGIDRLLARSSDEHVVARAADEKSELGIGRDDAIVAPSTKEGRLVRRRT